MQRFSIVRYVQFCKQGKYQKVLDSIVFKTISSDINKTNIH